MRFHPRDNEEVSIGLTPLIDVVFILLIFFMVTTTFNRNAELKIDLPEASTEVDSQEREILEIAIDINGRYFVNQTEVVSTQPRTLMLAIQKVLGNQRDLPVVIKADAKTPHQAVITAMDVAGKMGLNRISIATSFSPER